jgi:hypothetical protein
MRRIDQSLGVSRCHRHRLPIAALLVLLPIGAGAEEVFVDCRDGNPTESQFTRVSDAVGYLGARPALADWDYVLLRSDCADNVSITRSRIWIAPEWDSCPWNGCTTNEPPARITAADPTLAVVTVEGPHEVALVHLVLTGGLNGLAITNGGSVSAYGLIAEKNLGEPVALTGNGILVDVGSFLSLAEGGALDNAGYGIIVSQGASATLFGSQPWLQDKPLVISGNGQDGMRVDRGHVVAWAGVTIERNGGWGMLVLGGDVTFGATDDTHSAVQDNAGGGAFLGEGSEASLWGNTRFQENGPYGVYLDGASSAVFVAQNGAGVVVQGHSEVGVNVTTHGHASFQGPNVVRNNGAARKAWSAGVRVDGGSQAYFGEDLEGRRPRVANNDGSGILLDLGSVLEAPSVAVEGNSREAVRVSHQSTAYLGERASLWQNAKGPLRCDTTSLVVTNQVPKTLACPAVEKATEPRPTRPEPLPVQ